MTRLTRVGEPQWRLAMHLLPRPSQLDQTEEIFERGYSELEAYLAADELGFKAFWPVPAVPAFAIQAQRERPEDELLDIMIAAEALYLTQLGPGKDRGELRYRLALQRLPSATISLGGRRRSARPTFPAHRNG